MSMAASELLHFVELKKWQHRGMNCPRGELSVNQLDALLNGHEPVRCELTKMVKLRPT